MKKVFATVALAAFTGSAFAQLNPLPPATPLTINNIGLNAGATHWEAVPGLASYRFATDNNLGTPNTASPDNVLALSWASVSAQVQGLVNQVNTNGGIIRAIFLGESAGWLNDFGYSLSGKPQGPNSYTVFSNIQAVNPGATISYGQYIDINLGIGAASTFDFWLNGVGANGVTTPAVTADGGYYTVFNQSNSNPYIAPGNVRLTTTGLSVNTYIPSTGTYANVSTFLVGVEDWRLDTGADRDYNDFMFGLQFFRPDGTPFTPVPEPSTYGLIGAAALLGLVMVRRIKAKNTASVSAA
ncbi:MAG: PEP-CTERM sorting domain-containing protein [Nibricoccus sp.]